MLSEKEIRYFLNACVEGKVPIKGQVNFLKNFTIEKVTAREVVIFSSFMIENMVAHLKMPGAIDICGTGGSGLARINTSTIAAFILAQLGVKVAKHGNKAASGRFGSFDLLEKLRIDIEKKPEELEILYEKKGLALIFARNFHPVMKCFAEARKKLAKATIFNVLGPLLNPAEVKRQIIGISFKNQMMVIVEACKIMGKDRVMVVRGRDGLDEVTLADKTDVVELKDGKISQYAIGPEDFGIKKCRFDEIAGGDETRNLEIAEEILAGKCRSRHRDLVLINVALALKLAGKTEDLKEAYDMAKNVIGLGKLEACKGNILGEIAASKILPKSDRSFLEALRTPGVALIAEIKFASPSAGKIYQGNLGVKEIAQIYEENGARAISVLTDEKYFKGSFDNLRIAKESTKRVPILCKDFIIHEYQVYKAREYGADAVLLIAALLEVKQMKKLLKIVWDLEMEALVEIHDEKELKQVLQAGAKIIGINKRNLKTFETVFLKGLRNGLIDKVAHSSERQMDFSITNKLARKCPKGKIIVAESGINSRKDKDSLDKRIDAVLVGSAIMGDSQIARKVRELA